jgi:phosphoglycolate phosphatase-like HAD superfamily hydrolase
VVSSPERANISVAADPDEGSDWMRSLSGHYERTRRLHPTDELCIAFDIDGTILDLRHLVAHVLLAYDRRHGSDHFRGLVASDITHHEDDIEQILESLDVASEVRGDVAGFYRSHLWERDAVLAASRPFEGVFGVIRWFQLQPRTRVALLTGRRHALREQTLQSLNTIGSAFRVRFDPALLFTTDEGCDVPSSKVAAVEELERRGFRVVAVVDNEPENLRAMAADDDTGEILFLHADTIFRSQRSHHDRVITGRSYRLRDLVPARTFPGRVEFVWHGVNDEVNLERFLLSEVRWAEIDVRRDPSGRLVLRHDGFDETPWRRDEPTLLAADAIGRLAPSGRSVKLDVKENGRTLDAAIELVDSSGLGDDRVWLNAELEALGRRGFESLRRRFPRSTISAPVDFLMPLLLASEDATDHTLRLLRTWGVSRLSVRWSSLVRGSLDDLEERGWEVNLYGIPDLEAFLEASLLLPTSVTADFNFPEWRYFGRGSGAGGVVHHTRA